MAVTATQSRYEHGITRMQTCTIGMSMDADIKMRSRRRWKKRHIYIHSAKSVSEPLTRLPCPYNAVISIFRYGTVTVAIKRDWMPILNLKFCRSLKGGKSRLYNSIT